MIKADLEFLESLELSGEFNANECFNCGTCTALCPVGIEILPRELFRYALLGARERVLEMSDSIYSCLLCRMCEAHCPQGVRIAGNIRSLRSIMARDYYGIGGR